VTVEKLALPYVEASRSGDSSSLLCDPEHVSSIPRYRKVASISHSGKAGRVQTSFSVMTGCTINSDSFPRLLKTITRV
jgi:hypothetical protein